MISCVFICLFSLIFLEIIIREEENFDLFHYAIRRAARITRSWGHVKTARRLEKAIPTDPNLPKKEKEITIPSLSDICSSVLADYVNRFSNENRDPKSLSDFYDHICLLLQRSPTTLIEKVSQFYFFSRIIYIYHFYYYYLFFENSRSEKKADEILLEIWFV